MHTATTSITTITPTGEITLNIEFAYMPGSKPERGWPYHPGNGPSLDKILRVTDKYGEEADTELCYTLQDATGLRWNRLGDDKRIYFFYRDAKHSMQQKWHPYAVRAGEILHPWNVDKKYPPTMDIATRWETFNTVSRVVPLDTAVRDAIDAKLADMGLHGEDYSDAA